MVDNGKDRTAFLAGAGAAFLMIAQQVASKATRDAFFLSQYAVTALPVMLVVSSIFSIFVVFWFSGLLRRFQPSRLVPLAFLVSALLLSAEWWLTFIHPRAAAAVLYLHIGAFGSILISGFWSLVNERFDPRSGKRIVSRIATGGTLGGLAGGLLAERVAGAYPVTATMPLLSLLHIGTLILLLRFLRRPVVVPSAPDQEQLSDALSSLKILKYHRYLRSLAAFVLLCTACAAVLDYVLKAQAKSSLGTGEELLQFFGLYYSGVSLVTVLVQTLATRRALERFGVVKTLGVLPVVVGGGAVANLLLPGLATATFARGGESVLRNSLYRSSYELLYTPISPQEKRGTKTIVDVAFERLGDAVGGGVVRLVITVAPSASFGPLLTVGFLLSLVAILVTYWLHQGYVRALENNLRTRAVALELEDVEDYTTRRTLLNTLVFGQTISPMLSEAAKTSATSEVETRVVYGAEDPVIRHIRILRSGNRQDILRLLETEPVAVAEAPFLIELLAWDEVYPEVLKVLRKMAPRITGLLSDFLLNPEEEFTLRRRIPRVLVGSPTQRTAYALVAALTDQRFEVRYQSGRALALICKENPALSIPKEQILEAIRREVTVDRAIWTSRNPLDYEPEDEKAADPVDRYLLHRAGRSLEHVFNLLSLIYPREPVWIAFRGLHTDDPTLRGTALEYLESILPPDIKRAMWTFLENPPDKALKTDTPEALRSLMESSQSINASLERLKREGTDS